VPTATVPATAVTSTAVTAAAVGERGRADEHHSEHQRENATTAHPFASPLVTKPARAPFISRHRPNVGLFTLAQRGGALEHRLLLEPPPWHAAISCSNPSPRPSASTASSTTAKRRGTGSATSKRAIRCAR